MMYILSRPKSDHANALVLPHWGRDIFVWMGALKYRQIVKYISKIHWILRSRQQFFQM